MRRFPAFALAALLAACAGPDPATPPPKIAAAPPAAPVVRTPLPDAPVPSQATPSPGPPMVAPALAPVVVPADAIYVCVVDAGGVRRQTVIEFEPKVHALCGKHPEMGPCQYERDACRATGGRVYAAGSREITRAIEAEYDKKVMRVRLKSN